MKLPPPLQSYDMDNICIEGVVINATTFQERDRIISLFTPEEGLVKLVVKGAFSPQKGQGSTSTPLSQIEAICTKGRSELYTCRDLSVVQSNVALRQNLATLDAACDILQTIAATQQPGKAAPELYQLLIAFLTKLPLAPNPLAISTSFRLKTLHYEGLLEISPDFNMGTLLNSAEKQTVMHLAFSRDFSQIASQPVDVALAAKVKHLFQLSVD